MELKWLEDFTALARLRNFSQAAVERNVTQPAFSRRIRAVEEWFGVELIDRSTSPVSLTDAGEEFLPNARQLIAQTESIRHDVRLRHGLGRSTIRILTSHRLSQTVAPNLAADFMKLHPDAHISVNPGLQHYHEMGDYADALMSGAADLLLTYDHATLLLPDDQNEEIERLFVQREMIVPVAAPDYAATLGPDWMDNQDQRLRHLGYPKYSFTEKITESIVERFGERLDKAYESPVTGSVRAAALKGLGLAWLPMSVVEADIESNRLTRLEGEGLTATIEIVVFRRKASQNPMLEAFWRDVMNANADLS